MKNLICAAIAAGVAFVVSAPSASAATVTYVLQEESCLKYGSGKWWWKCIAHNPDYGSRGSDFDMTVDGITANFDGNAFKSIDIDETNNLIDAAKIVDAEISTWQTGAGVKHAYDGSHEVDGYGYEDFVEIDFGSVEMVIDHVVLSYWDKDKDIYSYVCYRWGKRGCKKGGWEYAYTRDGDDFRWMYDLSGDGSIGVGDYISDTVSENPFADFKYAASSVFAIGAFESNDAWKLHSVSFTHPIPLPAAGWLLLAGVGGLVAMRRKRRS